MIEKVLFALASVLVIEGCLLAVMPTRVKTALELLVKMSHVSISRIGLFFMVIGIILLSVIEI